MVLLRSAGHERVVTEPTLVEFGDHETLERYVVQDSEVLGWRGDRGPGDWTDVVFRDGDGDDAARRIASSAAGVTRDRADLERAHWLHRSPPGARSTEESVDDYSDRSAAVDDFVSRVQGSVRYKELRKELLGH